MRYDQKQLKSATEIFMKMQGYASLTLKFNGDSVWKSPHGRVLFIEEKTENESYNPSSWWKNTGNTLDGQRVHIAHDYNGSNDKKIWHQNKWMLAIAQLRADIKSADNPSGVYGSAVVLPESEISNFQIGFIRYHEDKILNQANYGENILLKIWNTPFSYVDQRNITILVRLIEIDSDNYFGTFWT